MKMSSGSEQRKLTLMARFLGVIFPMSKRYSLDPFAVKAFSKFNLFRLFWTFESRIIELFARASSSRLQIQLEGSGARYESRGAKLPDTAVTAKQLKVLLEAVENIRQQDRDIVEIGAFRGATTAELAQATKASVYAVDPFSGYGGCEDDLSKFLHRTAALDNVVHIRETSGAASEKFAEKSLGLVFIDGVHDFSNSWFDFCTWSPKIALGGFVIFHDVDDHPGVELTARRVLRLSPEFTAWSYCPNIIAFKKKQNRL